MVDALYLCDLMLNFFMAYEDTDKKIEAKMRMIAINYLQGWFFLDLLACVPFQYIEPYLAPPVE